ncbi:hypothetical protein FB45DRAFT_868700 [Roridomyces roridus]|uniref:Uncharacterized protein n=1 Tax=Roridomyces roridus TaxID=1738132 RepID=A0AAD7FJM7_9AGAR|nr:hypothetical protein FB45DRAFT_868700 [Roridomyces roridus]
MGDKAWTWLPLRPPPRLAWFQPTLTALEEVYHTNADPRGTHLPSREVPFGVLGQFWASWPLSPDDSSQLWNHRAYSHASLRITWVAYCVSHSPPVPWSSASKRETTAGDLGVLLLPPLQLKLSLGAAELVRRAKQAHASLRPESRRRSRSSPAGSWVLAHGLNSAAALTAALLRMQIQVAIRWRPITEGPCVCSFRYAI